MEKFYIDDVPADTTVSDYLKQNTDYLKKNEEVGPKKRYPKVLVIDGLNIDYKAMGNSIKEALGKYGDHGWISKEGVSQLYTGFSLTYNPNHKNNNDIHASTLGSKEVFHGDLTEGGETKYSNLKNSYFDTYAFCKRTPASTHGFLGNFIDRIKPTLVRSRLGVLHGEKHNPKIHADSGWHRDESIFENFRINIPIVTSLYYMFQIEGLPPKHFPKGFGYSWDTNLPHRVFSAAKNENKRIHIVLGCSPWFDYLPNERAWIKNDFFGKLHPYDMLNEGFIIEGVKVRDDIKIYDSI